jgi:hypothetical protein
MASKNQIESKAAIQALRASRQTMITIYVELNRGCCAGTASRL